jgi:probable F420-dependent oxidoreductase
MLSSIRVGVAAGVMTDGRAWLDLVRDVEACGFDSLYVSDHPGVTASPFAALAAAAPVTSTLRLGTYVCNTGVRDPLQVAADAATVDLVSDGRFILGLGAGHTPVEWTMTGGEYPSAGDRVARFGEFVEVVTRLLAGEVVTFRGDYLRTEEAFLLAPRPVQAKLPMLIGGNGRRLLRVAAQYADVISLTGLGRTLEDGHHHIADWSAASIDDRVDLIRAHSADRDSIQLDALVQHVEITDDRESAAVRVATLAPGLSPADVIGSPYALVGTADQIVEEMLHHRERWGFTSYVVPANAIEAMTPVLHGLGT